MDKVDVKKNVANTDNWLRGLFILIFGVIFYFLCGIIWLLVVFQFLTKIFTGELNKQLEGFSTKLTSYAVQILDYITYQSEVRPFPFSPFPEDGDNEPATLKVESDEKNADNDGG